MSQRYYLSTLIGSGTSHDPYRPKVEDLVGPGSAKYFIPVDANGHPTKISVLCIVNAVDHKALQNDPANIVVLPDVPLDIKLTAVDPVTLQGMVDKLQNAQLDPITDVVSQRDWLNKLGKQFDPAFDADSFAVV